MKKAITILVILIIITILALLILILKQDGNYNEFDNISSKVGDEGEVLEITGNIEEVEDYSDFKMVERCIKTYYDLLNNNSMNFYEKKDDGNYEKYFSDYEIAEMRLQILSQEYVNKNNINVNNVNNYIDISENNRSFIALDMGIVYNSLIDKYLVHGILINNVNEFLGDVYICVNIDYNNKTFSIEPLSNRYNSINEIEVSNYNEEIKENDNNKYYDEVLGFGDMATIYFSTYKEIVLSNPKIIYNYLDKEYREKRFKTEENFEKYINNNRREIANSRIESYLADYDEEYIQIVCKDQYDNMYTFKQIKPMEFSLELDTYTKITEKFVAEYENADDQKKVMMNIDKFIKMLNNRDYENVYSIIDNTFAQNTFGNEETFELYMRSNYPLHYKAKYSTFEKRGNNVYVQRIVLSDITENNKEEKEMSIIMRLEDNYDFVMSFEV